MTPSSTPRARRRRRRRRRRPEGYAADLDDEFVLPTVIDGYAGHEGRRRRADVQLSPDRAREILTALLDPRFDGFDRGRAVASSPWRSAWRSTPPR